MFCETFLCDISGLLLLLLLLFRYAKSKCIECLPVGIAVYFWWVSLKEKDKNKNKKKSSSPTAVFIAALVLELCVVEMLRSMEWISILSPPSPFSPHQLIFCHGDSGGLQCKEQICEHVGRRDVGCRCCGRSEQMKERPKPLVHPGDPAGQTPALRWGISRVSRHWDSWLPRLLSRRAAVLPLLSVLSWTAANAAGCTHSSGCCWVLRQLLQALQTVSQVLVAACSLKKTCRFVCWLIKSIK